MTHSRQWAAFAGAVRHGWTEPQQRRVDEVLQGERKASQREDVALPPLCQDGIERDGRLTVPPMPSPPQGFATWFETSAKNGTNVDEAVNFLSLRMLDNHSVRCAAALPRPRPTAGPWP